MVEVVGEEAAVEVKVCDVEDLDCWAAREMRVKNKMKYRRASEDEVKQRREGYLF